MINQIFNEPCLETLKKMSDKSIDCVITSPPYWQIRDYGYEGQWGLEPTYNEYLENLWGMMDEIHRVLKDEGTCWINLGDYYNNGQPKNIIKEPNKCLLLIPHRFAIGCIDRGWILRNDIIWAKRNAMPESVKDRFSKKHEYVFFMVKSDKYYFDIDSIREKFLSDVSFDGSITPQFTAQAGRIGKETRYQSKEKHSNPKGKNAGDVADFWDITTKPSKNKHYASYNDELLKKPVLAGCPENGIIYDPFMGTGSTAEVALRSNRNFIGSEMSAEYVKICEKRLSPFLTQSKLF